MSSSVLSRLHNLFAKTPKLKPTTTTTITTTTTPDPKIAVNVRNIVKQFKKKSKYVNFRCKSSVYETTVRRLFTGKHFYAIESILKHQRKYKDSFNDENFAVRLISLYGNAKMFDNARKLFDDLPSLGCNSTVISFNALLYACVNSQKYYKLGDIFRKKPPPIQPNTESYNIVIKAFCEMGALDYAIMVMNNMEKNGFKPDLITYNTILDAYYKSNNLSEAEILWDRLMKDKNVVPNAGTYNAKFRALFKNTQVSEVLKLMNEMEEKEVNLDMLSYNVIQGFIDDENLEVEKKWNENIVENCLVPYEYNVYNSSASDN